MSSKYSRRGFVRPFSGTNGVAAKRRKIMLGREGVSNTVRASAVSVKSPLKRGKGYGKLRKTYRKTKRIKANSVFRRAVKMIENEDKEMKYTSVARLDADIPSTSTGWRAIITADTVLAPDWGSNINLNSTALYVDAIANGKVVTGDSIVLNREGSEIYTKRIDLHFDATFRGASSGLKPPYFHVRLWVVQAKHLASSTTPSFQLWQAESKAAEIWKGWDSKSTQWFDPRSNSNSSQKNQFKVLKKMLIKVKNPYVPTINTPWGDVNQVANGIAVPPGTAANPTGGAYTTGAAIETDLIYGSPAAVRKTFFRSIYLGKNCLSTVYASDTSGDPSMGNIYVMAQAWYPYSNSSYAPTLSIYARACYKEDPGC